MNPKIKHYLSNYLLLGVLLTMTHPLLAQKVSAKKIDHLPSPPQKNTSLKHLSSGLQQIHQFQVHQRQPGGEAPIIDQAAIDRSFIIQKNQISVDLIAKSDPQLLLAELRDLRFTHLATFGKTISGRIDLDQLEQLARLETLQSARPVYKANRRIGSVDSQGDQAQYSDQGRTNYNVDGDGVKVGLLSDSYNTLSGEASGVASGDLPGTGNPNGYTTPVNILLEYSSIGSDEARAMAEIVHDVAPAAELYARTAFEGEADFAQGIIDLEAAGCKVIVDDIGYFAEPFFQDGIIAQAVDQVVDDGAIYFSAAGNSGSKSYEVAGFSDSGLTIGGSPLHDFDPSGDIDYTQAITIPSGVTFQMSLQWDDPFGSLPGAVDSADTDIDIRLYNSNLSSLVAYANDDNIASGDPLEIMSYTNNGATQQFNIVILHYSGPFPTHLKYVSWTNSITIDEYDTESSTIVGHPNSDKAIAIGAAAWYNTPAYGASPAAINDFSSLGGTPIFFDKLGNPISTITRQKPEFVGPDGANTTFFGADISADPDVFPNFFGTSAAAPHAAGAAALLVEMGATSRAEVLDAFINTSEDMDNPYTSGGDVGFDFATGFGMAQTNNAITHFVNLPVELIDFSVQQSKGHGALITWSTSSEINHKAFILKHQSPNSVFQEMTRVPGEGNRREINIYEHRIPKLSAGTHYFQLLQEDLDGSQTDHGIVSLEIKNNENQIWTFTSPNGQAIVVDSPQDTQFEILVYNTSGQLVQNQMVQVDAGERKVTELSFEQFSQGIYFYQVIQMNALNRQVHSGKFIR